MMTKNISMYAQNNWLSDRYYNTISRISDPGNGQSLVQSSKKIFWFDNISSDLYPGNHNLPTSADGVIITDRMICFVEFKTGFKKKITKQNFDADKVTCEHIHDICYEYLDLFIKNQRTETEQLICSIRDKAIESYITLEKKLLPICALVGDQKYKLVFIAVIDGNGEDDMEATLGELCSKEPSHENCFNDVRKALKRCANQKDAAGQDYYYDEIKVMSPAEFLSFINTCNLST